VVKHSLIFRRIFFKFAGHILQITMDYILIMFTHRVIKPSLILERILFKFAGHILQITHTTSSMGYVLVMFTLRAHVC
jgi:hypothetical protein